MSPPTATLLHGTTAALHALHPAAFLVLFTPVVPPPPSPAASPPHTDPFEPLGRALAQRHARIRHVPYVPAVGMTDTHLAFLRHAGAVVVVVVVSSEEDGKGAGGQWEFARGVVAQKAGVEELGDVPVCLVLVGGDGRGREFGEFGGVVWTREYGEGALREVAGVMVG
ncbi:uncharacterized protein BDZ99DRAFT_475502 [Mytilinidion resinicola]|uniref:Uncharacterized protein n=1 Tax=Mytilinidion resinicola TaxID=574789 RepID=A0A6A6YRC5_9PEZI|nr:uncharacterized protein BDZ99DRAFT_475502 [Mytilinidion resinicola]KAF2810584.1 hypothetical protein BDZ99DRAFT_475502 [Mytilinidion resinicola]